MAKVEAIIHFNTAKEAVDFARQLSSNQDFILSIYDIAAYEDWYFVLGRCSICGNRQSYFIPVAGYDRILEGCECATCGLMAIFPIEVEQNET